MFAATNLPEIQSLPRDDPSLVAVCGLPDPRKDHAVVMARFARDCMSSMREAVKKLEVELGPDTADLSMRIGLHSGPVTAGYVFVCCVMILPCETVSG